MSYLPNYSAMTPPVQQAGQLSFSPFSSLPIKPFQGQGGNLGIGGLLAGEANIMPSIGGFGPMAQMWGAGGALDSLFREDVQGEVNTTESVLGNAAQGALAGSYFGPWGAVIGGGIGALGGSK